MLEALGMTPGEERVYRVVVGGYRTAPDEIAGMIGVGRGELEPILEALLAKGLVSRIDGHYVSAPPDVSLGPLLVHGQEKLEAARAAVTQLAEEYRGGGTPRSSSRSSPGWTRSGGRPSPSSAAPVKNPCGSAWRATSRWRPRRTSRRRWRRPAACGTA
ncbi:helix-turn-helix domain-containing protein [Amycolatopsis sp. NPDC024027]|uniref:helix-turn-helix domain-containing protein n=1 Tax=Amycolatopsis sp. NPDC024027 TaxID=3154327 RepID=UPI0033FE244E